MEACGASFVKYLLFFFNLIFAIAGLIVLILGSVVLASVMEYGRFVDGAVITPPIILIVLGGVIFVVAFLGCCGAIKENYIMLVAFACLLAVIFIVQLAVGIAAGLAKDEFATAMRESLRGSMLNYTKNKLDQQTWDNMHHTLKCCGLDAPRGWGQVVGEGQVPSSCCLTPTPASQAPQDPPVCPLSEDPKAVYQSGCYEKIKVKIKDNIIIIISVVLAVAVIELAGIVLACCLASSIKRENAAKSKAGVAFVTSEEKWRREGNLMKRIRTRSTIWYWKDRSKSPSSPSSGGGEGAIAPAVLHPEDKAAGSAEDLDREEHG